MQEELSSLRSNYHSLLTEHSKLMLELGVLRQAKFQQRKNELAKMTTDAASNGEDHKTTTPVVHKTSASPPATTTENAPKSESSSATTTQQPTVAPTTEDVPSENKTAPSTSEEQNKVASQDPAAASNSSTSAAVVKSVALKPDVVINNVDNVKEGKKGKVHTVEEYTAAFAAGPHGVDGIAMAEALVERDGQVARLRAELKGTRKTMKALKKHCHIILEEARQAVDLHKKQTEDIHQLREARDLAERQVCP